MALPDDLDVAGRLLEHFQNNSTDTHGEGELHVPVEQYYAEGWAEAERSHLARQPIVVAHGSRLPEANSFLTVSAMGVPLLLVRQADGSVKGFRNVCRHRGGRVETEECGTKRVFTCRYHGWSYDRDGGLRNVPYGEHYASVESGDRICNGLVPVAVEERHGFVWAVLEETEVIDVAAHLGEAFDEQYADMALGDWDLYIEETYELPVNWKLVVEGANDVSHLKFLHPTTVGRLIQTNTHVYDRDGNHGRLSMARKTMDELRDVSPDAEDLRRYVVQSYFIYPNTMLNVQPASYELWVVWPDPVSPERSFTTIRVLTPPGMTDAQKSAVDKTWNVLLAAARDDDWPMEVWIQEGVRHTGTKTFVVGENEQPIQHFHRRLAENLGTVG